MRQPDDDRVLALVEGLTRQGADEPGVAVSVIRDGDVVARRYAGLARLEPRIPIGPLTRASTSSRSRRPSWRRRCSCWPPRGALRLDDDVRRYIPELPAPAPGAIAVTIRHLLSMTSGLRDVLEIERLRGVWTSSPSRTRELLDLA